ASAGWCARSSVMRGGVRFEGKVIVDGLVEESAHIRPPSTLPQQGSTLNGSVGRHRLGRGNVLVANVPLHGDVIQCDAVTTVPNLNGQLATKPARLDDVRCAHLGEFEFFVIDHKIGKRGGKRSLV